MEKPLQIEQVEISGLKAAPYNPRVHPEKAIARLKKSIEAFGYTNPVLVQSGTNVIIAGHARVKAAQEAGLDTVPVIYLDFDDTTAKAYNIADNRLAELTDWDFPLLKDLITEIDTGAIDIELTGFDANELKELLDYDAYRFDDQDDVIPETGPEPITEFGELIQLGPHRLLCGDSTDSAQVARLMGGEQADMVFTDPPYGIDYKGGGENTSRKIEGDNLPEDEFQGFLNRAFENYSRHAKPSAPFYIFHASRTQSQFEKALKKNGFEIRNQLIWNKPMAALGWGDYRWKHEPFFYAGRAGEKLNFYGDRTHGTVWDFQKSETQLLNWARKQKKLEQDGKTTVWSMARDNTNEYVHPTQKPAELIIHALMNSTKPGNLILDLFLGSGSTIIASEKADRRCFGMEIDRHFCDVIIKRWEDYTGQKAVKIE